MKDQPEEDLPFDVEEFDRWAATVPVDTEELSPEQEAEFAVIAAEYEAGRARIHHSRKHERALIRRHVAHGTRIRRADEPVTHVIIVASIPLRYDDGLVDEILAGCAPPRSR